MAQQQVKDDPGKSLAVIAVGLYLLNLLLPLLALMGIAGLYVMHRRHGSKLVRVNLYQTLVGSVISTSLFLLANLLIVILGGYRSLHALIIFEVYYILVVPLFLIPGLIALIKAMSGQCYVFPLILIYFGSDFDFAVVGFRSA